MENTKLEFRLFSSYGNIWDYGWVSFYSVFEDMGVVDNKDFRKFKKLLQSGVFNMVQLDGLCVVSALPQYVKRNPQNFMHSDNSPAIMFRDGYAQHYLNGVYFPEELFKKVTSGTMPFQDILAIKDIDQRTQAMRYGSVDDFMKHTKAITLDTYTKYKPDMTEVRYTLYKIPKGDIFQTDAYYMVYDCPSTNKKYMSGVTEHKTVAEAMAWKISDDKNIVMPEEWKTMIPLVHES